MGSVLGVAELYTKHQFGSLEPSLTPSRIRVYTGPELRGQPHRAHTKCRREVLLTEVTLRGQQSRTLIAEMGGSQHEGTRG